MKKDSHTRSPLGEGKFWFCLFEQNIISLELDLRKVSENQNMQFWKHKQALLLEHRRMRLECWPPPKVDFSFQALPRIHVLLELCGLKHLLLQCCHAKGRVPQEASPSKSGQISPYYLFMRVNFMCWHFTRHMEQPEPSCRQLSAAFFVVVVVLNTAARD